MKNKTYTSLGTMSGTSCDGIDVALIQTDGFESIEMFGGETYQYDAGLQKRIKAAMHSTASNIDLLLLERDLTIEHGTAINQFLKTTGVDPEAIDLIGFHGQTIFHSPNDGITQQIGNSQLLYTLTNINVVSDFRRRDVALGGQGAPLTPIFHKVLKNYFFGELNDPVAFLNIGGVSNITYIEGTEIFASDVGLGNAILDDYMMETLDIPYDKHGKIASAGKCIKSAFDTIMKEEFFACKPPKSLDRNHFHKLIRSLCAGLKLEDILATLSEVLVHGVNSSIHQMKNMPAHVIVCGGGRHNTHIIHRLRDVLAAHVTAIDHLKTEKKPVNGDFVEAYAFGYLAVRSLLNLPITFPSTTGIDTPATGGTITPCSTYSKGLKRLSTSADTKLSHRPPSGLPSLTSGSSAQ